MKVAVNDRNQNISLKLNSKGAYIIYGPEGLVGVAYFEGEGGEFFKCVISSFCFTQKLHFMYYNCCGTTTVT